MGAVPLQLSDLLTVGQRWSTSGSELVNVNRLPMDFTPWSLLECEKVIAFDFFFMKTIGWDRSRMDG